MASSKNKPSIRNPWRDGEAYVWATGAALTFTLFITITLIAVVLFNGLSVMWPRELVLLTLQDGSRALGNITQEEHAQGEDRLQLRVGNRDLYGLDFRWLDEANVVDTAYPEDAVRVERREYGDFHGFLVALNPLTGDPVTDNPWEALPPARDEVREASADFAPQRKHIADLAHRLDVLHAHEARLQYDNVPESDPPFEALEKELHAVQVRFEEQVAANREADEALDKATITLKDVAGTEVIVPLADIVRITRPNEMGLFAKVGYYISRIYELLTQDPRESNTEGGLFPAIFGTVSLIFIMSIFSFPLGVLAAIYLREYAKEGPVVRMVHIAVNNLAGIPSIVYGIFGLGFFVYGIGGAIDRVFFPEHLPEPTFGTGGILWASLTLALLTVPVVIVATEEALSAVPKGIREGSYALGATRLQTLVRTVLPMASPGIMTGFILAMARAAGEVAPLMITGVVKLAPALPLDGDFPFVHLDRKFMHLGFHIYDIGFQSPNVEAAKPMVYVTTLLLVLIVLFMSSVAIYLRSRMRRRFEVKSL